MNEIEKINQAIDQFASEMKKKMIANIGKKSGWNEMSILDSMPRLREEIAELEYALPTRSKAQPECIDVANFAMIVWYRLMSYDEQVWHKTTYKSKLKQLESELAEIRRKG